METQRIICAYDADSTGDGAARGSGLTNSERAVDTYGPPRNHPSCNRLRGYPLCRVAR